MILEVSRRVFQSHAHSTSKFMLEHIHFTHEPSGFLCPFDTRISPRWKIIGEPKPSSTSLRRYNHCALSLDLVYNLRSSEVSEYTSM